MEPKIRVLQIVPHPDPGGAENVVWHLACNLNKDRFESGVVSLYDPISTDSDVQGTSGVAVRHLGKRAGFDARMFARIRGALRWFRPDVVHSHLGASRYLYPLLLEHPIPAAHTLHNLAEHETDVVGRWMQCVAFRAGVAPVAIATEVANSIRRLYGVEPAALIPNCIPVKSYQSSAGERQRWRARHGFEADDILYASVARLEEQKNPRLLLSAFANGPGRNSNAQLLFVGEGSLRRALEQETARLNLDRRVHFLGMRSDIAAVLAASDVFVLASDWEGRPIAVMEAMAAGLFVVATAVGGVPELLGEGALGVVVPPSNLQALIDALLKPLENPDKCRAIGHQTARYAAEHFDVPAMVEGYESLYERLVRGTRKNIAVASSVRASRAQSNGTKSMIVFERGPITIAETYFEQPPAPATNAVDLVRWKQCSNPIQESDCEDFHSLVLDLRKDPDELFSKISGENRRQIRKALRDGLTYEWWNPVPDAVLIQVCERYEEFARRKGLPKANRGRLAALAAGCQLDVSCARGPDADDDVLVWHVYYRSASAVRLLHSFSEYRERPAESPQIGRANRYNHWQDILRFQREGILHYDFGGWYAGTEDKEKLRINRFKEQFGGTVVRQYNCIRVVTWKGQVALQMFKLLNKSRKAIA